MQKINISVALPVYNSQSYIVTQLKSIINQTEQPDEIIVCDDQSTDFTVTRIKEYIDTSKEAKKKIKLFKNSKRLGMNNNFQEVIDKCKGDIIFLSDSDDYWFRNKIKFMKNFLLKNNLLILINDCRFTDGNLKPLRTRKLHQVVKVFNSSDNFIPGCCTVFKSELVKFYLPLPEHISSYDSWLFFVGNFLKKRMIVNKVFQLYRRHGKNNTYAIFNSVTPIGLIKRYAIIFKIFLEVFFNRKKIIKNKIKNYEVLKERLINHNNGHLDKKIDICNKILNNFYRREKILHNFFLIKFYKIYLIKKNKKLWENNLAKFIDLICVN